MLKCKLRVRLDIAINLLVHKNFNSENLRVVSTKNCESVEMAFLTLNLRSSNYRDENVEI